MIDWATTRLGEPWTFRRKEHIDTEEGWVITSPKTVFTPEGLKVTIGMRAPWFPISLGERIVDAKKFQRMQIRARATREGRITLRTHSPGHRSNVRTRLDPGFRVTTRWRTFDVNLRKAKLIGMEGGARARRGTRWGGPEGAIDRIYFHLDFPLDEGVIVEISKVRLLGKGKPDREPPVIAPLPDRDGALRLRITDPAGVLPSSLLLVVNDVVYGPRSRSLRWDGKILSWKSRRAAKQNLHVSVEACDREGNRASLDLQRSHLLPASGRRPAPIRAGFRTQRRSHSVILTRGNRKSYRIRAGGMHEPVNRSIEIRGPVENPKILVEGNIDFETPHTIVSGILDGNMSVEEQSKRIWRFVMENVYVMGMGNPVDRTKYLNSCGYGFCGSQAPVQMALYEAAGVPWMHLVYTWPCGHLSVQVFFDGRWHIIDSMNRGWLLTDNGRTIASAEEIEGDPDIIGPTEGAMTPAYRRNLRWPKMRYRYESKGKELSSGSMAMRLRRNENLLLKWAPLGRWSHAPSEPADYANGRLTFRPLAETKQWERDSESTANVVYSGEGDCIRPGRAGKPAYVTYGMHSPYLVAGGSARLDYALHGAGNRIAVSVSADGGRTWRQVWQAGPKTHGSAQMDLTRWMSRRTVEEDRPLFRDVHEFLLRLEMLQENRWQAPEVYDLTIASDLQIHTPSLQALRRGENRCTFTCSSCREPVTICHSWDEADALRASSEHPARGEKVTLSAKIRNDEAFPVGPLTVRFFDGHPDADGVPIGKALGVKSIPPKRSATVETRWTAEPRANRPLTEESHRYLHTDIYATVDLPRNRIADEGYTSMNRLRLRITDRPRMNLPSNAVRVEPDDPRPGRTVTLGAIVWNVSAQKNLGEQPEYVYWNGAELRNVRVRFYNGDPRKTGRPIGQKTIRRIPPCEHGTARIRWRTPRKAGRLDIYVVASHETGPSSAHQRIVRRRRVDLQMTRPG